MGNSRSSSSRSNRTFSSYTGAPGPTAGRRQHLSGTAALLASWGVFIYLNRAAEELEPEAMEDAKCKDSKLRQD